MIIWFALLIPAATAVILSRKYAHRVVWWEYLLLLVLSLSSIAVAKHAVEKAQVRDTEYWGGWVTESTYTEFWDEEVPCRHPIYRTESYSCGTSKEPRTCTRQVDTGLKQHAYDVDTHGPDWLLEDQDGTSYAVSSDRFETLCRKFGQRTFVAMHHEQDHKIHSANGNAYTTRWDGTRETCEAMTTTHTYENRIIASTSILRFPDVPPDRVKAERLYDYPQPDGDYHCPALLGYGGPQAAQSSASLDYWNAMLGPKKQIRLWLLTFIGQPLQAGVDQESYWQGGNKNELVVCVGLDKAHHVQWAYVFSWTKREDLKVSARTEILSRYRDKEMDYPAYIDWLAGQVQQKWQRRHFKEFNYLTVEPPLWAVLATYLFNALLCAGVGFFVVNNQASPWRSRR